MAKIRKASATEKANYTVAGYKVHPLFGFIKVEGSLGGTKARWDCAVEYLGEGPENPNYEVLAPDGMRFRGGTHTLMGETQKDLCERIAERLETCPDDCDCKEVPRRPRPDVMDVLHAKAVK